MPSAWVYILRCADGSYYTGLTKQEEPETREWEHMRASTKMPTPQRAVP